MSGSDPEMTVRVRSYAPLLVITPPIIPLLHLGPGVSLRGLYVQALAAVPGSDGKKSSFSLLQTPELVGGSSEVPHLDQSSILRSRACDFEVLIRTLAHDMEVP